MEEDNKFMAVAKELADLVNRKNKAYGDSFIGFSIILNELYPRGIQPEQYPDILLMVRMFDKFFRIATSKDAFGENPWKDIAGYSLLALKYNNRVDQGEIK